MRKLLVSILGVFLIMGIAYAAYKSIDLQSGARYYKDSVHLDTTDWVWIADYDNITLSVGIAGSSSNTFTTDVQGYFGETWHSMYKDTVSDFTVSNLTIKNADTNLVGAAYILRFVNSITSTDSSALLKYYESIYMTK